VRVSPFGEMAAACVHRLQQSLMSIIGYSTLLLEEEALLEVGRSFASVSQKQEHRGERASHVVSRLREFLPTEGGPARIFVNLHSRGCSRNSSALTPGRR